MLLLHPCKYNGMILSLLLVLLELDLILSLLDLFLDILNINVSLGLDHSFSDFHEGKKVTVGSG